MRSVAEHKAFLQSLAAKVPNPQAGFFGPGSVAWRLNGEAVLGLVVLRALFLQVAHPKVAQGVADHSDFRHRPFERALATFKAQQRIVFGTCEESIDALMRIYARHVSVRGEDYEANDPTLLFWVYATLIDSMFFAYRTFLPDLSAADSARFYEEGKLFAKLIGIADNEVPAKLADFEGWMQAKLASDEITVSPAGYEVGQSLLRMPIGAAKPLTGFIAAGTLPPKLREEFGLRWSAKRQWLFDRLAATVRFSVRLLPGALHTSPAYWFALHRVKASQ
jgi:uncharacterized protein (DUF2236 family)